MSVTAEKLDIGAEVVEQRPLDDHGLASVSLTIRWSDGTAEHEDQLHVDKFSVWREADALPADIAAAIPGMRSGDRVSGKPADRGPLEPWDPRLERPARAQVFDRHHRRGMVVEPRLGRFYPQGFFHNVPGIFEDAVVPARISDLGDEAMRIDLNHPMARYPFQLTFQVEDVLPGFDRRGGRCASPLDDLLQFTGLTAPLPDGRLTDYGDHGDGLRRLDEVDDGRFYAKPRMLQHLDRKALQQVNALYRRLIAPSADVLDLMASHDSHLRGTRIGSLQLLGMNREELIANPADATRTVQDLNSEPRLPFEDTALDAVVCTASIEYLVQPRDVLQEVLRVLRPGGVFVTSFSNRWFPTKAIRIWSELHEFERVGLVTQWYRQAGFSRLSTFSTRGWPRPQDDPHAGRTALADPVYAVWGYKD